MEKVSEQNLIKRYFTGDEKALETLISLYLKPVYSFVYRYVNGGKDAEDITQEVFVKAWRNLKKFDQNRSFKIWIFEIAKNTSLDFLKKKKEVPFSAFEDENGKNALLETLADPAELPQEILHKRGIAQLLKSAISRLSTKYREVLSLRYNFNFTFKEMAKVLAEPLHTTKSRHRRGLIELKKILEQAEPQ